MITRNFITEKIWQRIKERWNAGMLPVVIPDTWLPTFRHRAYFAQPLFKFRIRAPFSPAVYNSSLPMRVSQFIAETSFSPTPAIRTSQFIAETTFSPTPAIRVSQYFVEATSTKQMQAVAGVAFWSLRGSYAWA